MVLQLIFNPAPVFARGEVDRRHFNFYAWFLPEHDDNQWSKRGGITQTLRRREGGF